MVRLRRNAFAMATLLVLLSACASGPAAAPSRDPASSASTEVTPSASGKTTQVTGAPSASLPSEATPSISGITGRILFTRAGGAFGDETMFLANIDGSSEQQVGPKQSVCCPFVSRDGTRVAYTVSEADGILSVVSDIGGGNPVTVEPPQGLRFGTGPFIPDDTRMVFEGFRDDMAFDHTYIADIDGANERVLTEEHFVPGDISPDGKTVLLFKTKESSSPRPGTLWLVDIDGTNLRQLTTTPLAQCCFNFRWSPDGSKIIFAAPEGGLWTVTPAGEALVEVVHVDGQWAITPTWSPDGSMLLFALDPSPDPFQHPANALYVTHADGSDLTKVVGGNDFKREPVWLRP